MTWFSFKQNNSGGYWDKPAIQIVVEASSESEAIEVAKRHGLDEGAPYCDCCGERWSEYVSNKYDHKPDLNKLFGESYANSGLYKGHGVPRALYVGRDGSTETID